MWGNGLLTKYLDYRELRNITKWEGEEIKFEEKKQNPEGIN